MKNLKNYFLAIGAFLLFSTNSINAQDQMYWVHVDQVKPSKQADYEKVAKEFAEACKTNNVPDMEFNTWRYSDGSYVYASPMNNFAEMDKDAMKQLRDKMGKEKFKALFDKYDQCYDDHHSFMATFKSDLSYMNDGKLNEGDFREIHYLYVTPSNSSAVAAKIKEIKDLFTKKGSKAYFAVMHSGFGADKEFYAVLTNAKDEGESYKIGQENNKLLGEEWPKIWSELFPLLSKYDSKMSKYRSDLSYTSKK